MTYLAPDLAPENGNAAHAREGGAAFLGAVKPFLFQDSRGEKAIWS
jgi:hypothetical protein